MNSHFVKWAFCWLHFEIGKKIYFQWFRRMQQHKKILKSSISEKNAPFLFMQQATNVSFQQEFLDYCIRYILFLLLFTQQAIQKNNVQFFAISIMYPPKKSDTALLSLSWQKEYQLDKKSGILYVLLPSIQYYTWQRLITNTIVSS